MALLQQQLSSGSGSGGGTGGTGTASPRPLTAVEARTLVAVEEMRKAGVVSRKFVDCRDARELRVGEIEELLAEYRRLAGAVGKVFNA